MTRVVPQSKPWCFRPVPKVCFWTIASAERAAENIGRRSASDRELVIFFCTVHQAFHLGHQPRKEDDR
jgi:hypothetical protein